MNVSCILSAGLAQESVNVVAVNSNGSDIYITYVDASSNLKVQKKKWTPDAQADGSNIIGTNATIV